MLEESRIHNDIFEKIYTHKNECVEFNHEYIFISKAKKQIIFNKIFFKEILVNKVKL